MKPQSAILSIMYASCEKGEVRRWKVMHTDRMSLLDARISDFSSRSLLMYTATAGTLSLVRDDHVL